MKILEKYEAEFLVQRAIYPYTFSDFNFDSEKNEATFIYKEIKYLVSFTPEKGKVRGAVVHYFENGNIYSSDLSDLIQVCILHQIKIDSLESKLYSRKGEK